MAHSKERWFYQIYYMIVLLRHRLSSVTTDHCAISNHSAAICHRMCSTFKSPGAGYFVAKFWEEEIDLDYQANTLTVWLEVRYCHLMSGHYTHIRATTKTLCKANCARLIVQQNVNMLSYFNNIMKKLLKLRQHSTF